MIENPTGWSTNGSCNKNLQRWCYFQAQRDSGALVMSPGFKYSPSLSSAFQGIGFILRLQGWTLTALGLPNPHLRLKSRRKRTFSPSIVCMEIISLTGSHWSQSGPWTFPCGQGMSLALSKCHLQWGWGAERGGRTIPLKEGQDVITKRKKDEGWPEGCKHP